MSFKAQRKVVWAPVERSLKVQAGASLKVKDLGEFMRTAGPGMLTAYANLITSSFLAGLVRPAVDGNNMLKRKRRPADDEDDDL